MFKFSWKDRCTIRLLLDMREDQADPIDHAGIFDEICQLLERGKSASRPSLHSDINVR